MRTRLLGITVAMTFFTASSIFAQEASVESGGEPKNEIAAFLGLTHEGRRDNAAALGLEYERRLNERFGIGGLAEFTGGSADFWVFAIPLTIHVDRWKLVFAPGLEDNGEHTEKLLRLGAGYEFEAGGLKMTPSLNADFVDGETVLVAGVSFGIGF